MALPVFADVDTGIDDALALVYLLASDDADLVGLASTAGNVSADQVCRNNLCLLEVCGATGIPVSRGVARPLVAPLRTAEDTHGPTGLGYAELPTSDQGLTRYDAAEAWVRAARANPGTLVGLASGPLTNLALALRAEPALPTLLRRLVIVGGSFGVAPGDARADRNTAADPEAAAEVYCAWGRAARSNTIGTERLPLTCGLNVTELAMLTPEHLHRLPGSAANPLMAVVNNAVRFRFEVNVKRGLGNLAYLHDPLAAAVALDPGLIRTRPAAVEVAVTGTLEPGRTVAHWNEMPNAQVGVEVDAAEFLERFLERVGRFARRLGHS